MTASWRAGVQATLHCLTGCAIGEMFGMVLAAAFGWGNAISIATSVALAFLFGYTLMIRPVLRAGVGFRRALGLAFASDTVSIGTMEIVDNAFILVVPGAITATLGDGIFWWSLAISLAIAFRAGQPLADRPRPRSCSRARAARALTRAVPAFRAAVTPTAGPCVSAFPQTSRRSRRTPTPPRSTGSLAPV